MLSNLTKVLTNAFRGPAQARAAHRQALRLGPSIALGVDQLQTLCPSDVDDDNEAPIFLLSAGWRSGSTLLQRLIMSDKNVLIWGEPYDECGLVQGMAESMQAFRPGWPPKEYFYDGTPPDQLTGAWVANLFPSLDDWRKGQRALFDTMFSEPAKRAGAPRWGIKEVRFTAEHCAYLRWLYPKARFLFLIRNPLEAYRSYCRYGRSWYDIFPNRPVFTPTKFGQHWRKLAEGMVAQAAKLDARVIRYEDLIAGKVDLQALGQYLGTRIDQAVLNKKVGSSEREGKKVVINALERWLLRKATDPVAGHLGYRW